MRRNLSCYCLLALHIYGLILHVHRFRGELHIQRNTTREVATTSPPFCNEPHRSHVHCVKAWTRYDLHILVSAPFCCVRKSRVACAQSFAPWHQATIEIMPAISLTIACSHYISNGVILYAHPVRGESRNQRNATGEVAPLFVVQSFRISWFCWVLCSALFETWQQVQQVPRIFCDFLVYSWDSRGVVLLQRCVLCLSWLQLRGFISISLIVSLF